jgi:hypothetical protein
MHYRLDSSGFGTVTMMRTLFLLAASVGLVVFAFAFSDAEAQTSTATSATCPRGALKIYFASGGVTASPQAQALIGKIGETATSCEPDHIDLVAHFDPAVDGLRAVTVALERLSTVSADLVSQGFSASRIRIAAQAVKAGEVPVGHLNQIDVLFRKASETSDGGGDPAPVTPATIFRSETI